MKPEHVTFVEKTAPSVTSYPKRSLTPLPLMEEGQHKQKRCSAKAKAKDEDEDEGEKKAMEGRQKTKGLIC